MAVVIGPGTAPVLAINDNDNTRPVPPGLQKKLERGGSLPPGWRKKIVRGADLDQPVYDNSKVFISVDADGTVTMRVED